MAKSSTRADLDSALRVTGGFRENERTHLLSSLAPLAAHLARWEPDQVDVQLSVKERDKPEQAVRIEVKLGNWPVLVATAADDDLDRAVHEARTELIRQLESERTKRSPKGNRKLRKTLD